MYAFVFLIVYNVTHLHSALDEEGLLRISGSVSEIQQMRADIEQGKPIDFSTHDPHAVAGIVKCFFRELPEKIVPTDLNNYAATVAGTYLFVILTSLKRVIY